MQTLEQKKVLILFADACEAAGLFRCIPFQQISKHVYQCTKYSTLIHVCIFYSWGPQGVHAVLSSMHDYYDHWINAGFAGACTALLPLKQCVTIDCIRQLNMESPPQINTYPALSVIPVPFLSIHSLVSAHQPYVHGFRTDCTLVDMEGYTIAQYATQRQVRCSMIKITSDYTDPLLRKPFADITDELSDCLAQEILKYLKI